MRFGTRNVRSRYRAGSLTAAARELARYEQDLVSLQEVRWDKGDTVRGGDCIFTMEGNENHQLGTGFLYTTEFLYCRRSYKVKCPSNMEKGRERESNFALHILRNAAHFPTFRSTQSLL